MRASLSTSPLASAFAACLALACTDPVPGVARDAAAGPDAAGGGGRDDATVPGGDGDADASRDDAGALEPREIVVEIQQEGHWRLYIASVDQGGLRPAITGDARGSDASVRGGRVVFTRPVDGRGTVFAAELEGEPEQLTSSDATELTPVLSPDGQALVFARIVSGSPKLFVSDANGDNARRLTSGFGSSDTVEQSPSFSPDGTKVVFSAAVAGLPDLFIADVETGEVEPLRSDDDALIEPAWEPSGERIAFAKGRVDRVDVHLLEVGSGEVVRLTDGPGQNADPAWLPRGEIAFAASDGGARRVLLVDPAVPGEVRALDTGDLPARGPASIH